MSKSSVRWLMALSVGLALGACKDDEPAGDGDMTGDESTTTDAVEDTSTDDGTVDDTTTTGEDPPEIEWEFEPVYGVPNLDDDDGSGQADWFQVIFPAEDDHTVIPLPAVPAGYSVELSMQGNLEGARVWYGQFLGVGSGDGNVIESYTFSPPADTPTELQVEFGDDYVGANLTLRLLDPDGAEAARADVLLRSSPVMLNHHLQPTEHVWVVDVNAGFGTNADMVADYADVLGEQFTPVPGASYEFDVWIQDELQLGYSLGSQGQRADTVIDSIRDRGLDDFPEDYLADPGFNIRTWGDPAQVTTWDSFGNLENSPPVTVDGVEYPFGRIYYGKMGNLGIHPEMSDYLESQDIQAPVELDTFWLCVGHVDEFSTFVPDPDSPKGFKFVITDVPAAYDLLETLPPEMVLTRYGADHDFPTVGDILDDVALRNLNEDLQADEIDPIVDTFIAEFGLEEADIVRMPSLFETIGGCGGGTAALIPGMVNLIVANLENGESHLFIPDPYFRTDVDDQATDPIIEAFTNNLPASLFPHYVDDWDVYHLGLGEVHCGTNMTRTPTANWWEVGLHLLGG